MTNTMKYSNISDLQKYNPEDIRSVISSDPGIYIWWDKEDLSPVYIGVALNKRGLLGRVARQHLCPTYIELRKEKTESAAITAEYKGRKAIEKSVFRKKVSNKFGILPGTQCVNYIKENFLISLLPLPTIEFSDIKEIERQLIAKHNPLYNTKFTDSL